MDKFFHLKFEISVWFGTNEGKMVLIQFIWFVLVSFLICSTLFWSCLKTGSPSLRLNYSRKNKLISLMRIFVDEIKIFNPMRSHKISQISHFRIKYEYSASHLKEKISRHLFLYTLCFLCDKDRGIFVSSPQSFLLLSNTI